MAIAALLLCSCGTSDYFVAAPVPGVGSVVVSSAPVTPRVVVATPYGYYSSGYYYYSPTYRRKLPPPPPPRKRHPRR